MESLILSKTSAFFDPPLDVSFPTQEALAESSHEACVDPHPFDADAWFQTPEMLSPNQKYWLEVQVSWKGGILDIGHYQTPRRLTFGFDPKADFCYPLDNLPHDSAWRYFPLLEPAKTGFLFCFDPEMDGQIEHNGERFSLLALVKEGRAHYFNRTGLCYYPLFPGVQVHLRFDGLEVAIRFVSPPQIHVAFFRTLDTFVPVLSFSVILHILVLFFAWMGMSGSPFSSSSAPPSLRRSVAGMPSQDKASASLNASGSIVIRLPPIYLRQGGSPSSLSQTKASLLGTDGTRTTMGD